MKHGYWLAIILVMGIAGAAWAQQPGVIRATGFVLVDDQGRERANWYVGSSFSGMTFKDENGNARVMLLIFESETLMFLSGENNHPLSGISLGTGKDGSALCLHGKNGELRITLNASEDRSELKLYDDYNKERVRLDADYGSPGLRFYDFNGKVRAGMDVDVPGPSLWLFDENGKEIWGSP